jgi:2-polyprenyl-3-methyl-5-hydroxy-6-metoxy-1,4-benzoquinol methylase
VTDEELTAAIQEVRQRARARAPQGPTGLEGVAAADLMPLVQARDAAEAKVAAIGTVNPRPPGLRNSLVQAIKRVIARALDWHVREQVEFNRASMACVQAALEALNAVNRSVAALAAHHQEISRRLSEIHGTFEGTNTRLADLDCWRAEFEQRYMTAEIRMLRTISELQAAYQHRLTVQDENFRESLGHQHAQFTAALDRKTIEIQQRLWDDLRQVRLEFEGLIHRELRTLRQKSAAAPPAPAPAPPPAEPVGIDWIHFAERFRGSQERIRAQQQRYVDRFAGTEGEILDLGCGRGEFLAAARDAGLRARGVDASETCVALCRAQGLEAELADIFAYLEQQPDGAVAGAYCAQVIEHLPPAGVVGLIALLGRKLRPGALVAIETPNPECLAIFATHFYIDPTHTRPVPPALLHFYLEEAGFGGIEIERLAPAVESMPQLAGLPAGVRDAFFGGLDYAAFARKL